MNRALMKETEATRVSFECRADSPIIPCRFSLIKASRFISEYFLNTFAPPCRNNCATHSSATPPALSRDA
jgi:hypothetical protein